MTSVLITRGEEAQAHTQEGRAWSDIAIVKEHQGWPGAARSQDLESVMDSFYFRASWKLNEESVNFTDALILDFWSL